MEIVTLPPLRMIAGQPYSASWVFRSKTEGEIDFTKTVHGAEWSGRLAFFRTLRPHPSGCISSFSLILTSLGRIILDMSVADVARLHCCGPRVIFQINLDAPLPDLNEVWRGAVVIQ